MYNKAYLYFHIPVESKLILILILIITIFINSEKKLVHDFGHWIPQNKKKKHQERECHIEQSIM